MKKISTAFLSFALCASVNAQTMKILSVGLGVPGIDEPQLVGLSISPNGKYVCGAIENGDGYFIADLENDNVKYDVTVDFNEGAELRHIDNNGLAIGYDGPGITYSIDGIRTVLETPSDAYKYVLGEALSNDGSVKVGSLVPRGFNSLAAYSKDGGEWTLLPAGTEEQIGVYAEEGSAAKYVSGDGKAILGFVGSFGPAVLWLMNDEGEYEFDPLYTRFVITSDEDLATGEKVLVNLFPASLSNNGKFAALKGVVIEDEGYRMVPAVYNLEEGTLNIYSEPQEIDMMFGLGLTPTAIADDGTIIGIIGDQPFFSSSGSFIWRAGEDKAVSFLEAFPCYEESFGFFDFMGYCVPTGISADGRYIQGYGFYSEDPFDEDVPAYNATYVIDTQNGTSGIEAPVAENPTVQEAVYSIDGKRMSRMAKGLNIVRMSDGTVRKVLNK